MLTNLLKKFVFPLDFAVKVILEIPGNFTAAVTWWLPGEGELNAEAYKTRR
jgi:hypothetical protein